MDLTRQADPGHNVHRSVAISFFLIIASSLGLMLLYKLCEQNRNLSFIKGTGVASNGNSHAANQCFVLCQNNTNANISNEVNKTTRKCETFVSNNSTIQVAKSSNICRRYIFVEKGRGRLGNQMFQTASLLGMAHKYDVIPVIPKEMSIHRYFNLPNIKPKKDILDIVNTTACKCAQFGVYKDCASILKSGTNVSIHGFLQSWKYFAHAQDIIRNVFQLRSIYKLKARNFIERLSKTNHQLVCIHIRRGDMLEAYHSKMGFGVANVSFIEKARAYYVSKYNKVQFIAVSDDKVWCKKNLKNIIISPFTNAGEDLALMTLCDHVIVTSGTFGWWGAWLSGGTIVYYTGYPTPGSYLDSNIDRNDYYPPEWIGMA